MFSSQEQLLNKIKQDVISRWAIALIEVGLIYLFWWTGLNIKYGFGNVSKPIIIILSVVTILNLIIHFAILKRKKIPLLSGPIIKLIDIGLITYVVWFTGAIKSPFYIVYI
ncbi:MAG: hypothetical protein KAT09_04600, partial [Candidatus Aegiribacteria sp.]|nr:hypothetical protein [Candidatus Aegiribacteria sp.]